MNQFSKFAKVLCLCVLAALSAAAMAGDGHQSEKKLKKIAEGEHRSDANKARNDSRNPAETLAFFGLKPDMTVVEIWPGGGWYTEVLAPYVNGKGQYIAAAFPKNPEHKYAEYFKKANKKLAEKLEKDKAVYGNVTMAQYFPENDLWELGPAGKTDMILTFRNLHNWMPGLEKSFQAFYDNLKPGGVLGVVEHRTQAEQDPKAENGYMNQDYVIEIAKKVGFKLAGSSEVNANAKDKADHPQGVWTLPPTLALGEKDADKYKAIGESDRMTLKFVKPN
ncbi:class I SAM-dependent methyltransferase [Acanthopleuribacter pedis]|uniref:Class I SAM-dependent methyltransferase n=1 Tax=Acanthopleuribacter pedis TaxID=442870 RepID=A0A8J7QFG1_9BACT|nr:class I SAM-dependent methyltransferase [Acanthopleuribacter pedis]MBO1318905.1 class I SAM-dependent methyltransferase [Acanthopleuribacter pedis]